jgi:hypothetical protein
MAAAEWTYGTGRPFAIAGIAHKRLNNPLVAGSRPAAGCGSPVLAGILCPAWVAIAVVMAGSVSASC